MGAAVHMRELGDGEFAPRSLSNRKAKVWVEEHNPYKPGSASFHLWASKFWSDQADAVWDWRRSGLELTKRILFAVAGLFVVVGLVAGVVSALISGGVL